MFSKEQLALENMEQERADEANRLADPLFHVVLVEPEIPNNTGSIGRSCLGLGAKLWLVRPFGFKITDHELKRAGLDYWPMLDWEAVDNWEQLLTRIHQTTREIERFSQEGPPRFWFFSKKAETAYYEASFKKGDIFVYGKESVGLSEVMMAQYRDNLLRIPISNKIRSLNLSVAVGITLFEAQRQIIQ